MNPYCLRDLVELIGGELRFGSLPPVGGDWEPIGRIVTDSRNAREGDLFWGLMGRTSNGSHFAEHAFARGAIGAVVSGRKLEPWAGKFAIEVEDSAAALQTLLAKSEITDRAGQPSPQAADEVRGTIEVVDQGVWLRPKSTVTNSPEPCCLRRSCGKSAQPSLLGRSNILVGSTVSGSTVPTRASQQGS